MTDTFTVTGGYAYANGMESGWVPWLIKEKTSAYEALYFVGGKYLLWLFGWLGFEPRLAIWLNIQALRWGLHACGWECGPWPAFASNYALAFTLQLRKITVKPQSGQPKIAWQITAKHDSFGWLGHRLAVASTGLLAPVALALHFERRGQPSARVNICRVAELRGSPHQLTLSQNSQLGLWCGRRKEEHPNPRESACY